MADGRYISCVCVCVCDCIAMARNGVQRVTAGGRHFLFILQRKLPQTKGNDALEMMPRSRSTRRQREGTSKSAYVLGHGTTMLLTSPHR